MTKFSIITVVFNDKQGVERTIKSVVDQTYKDFEYIIIDGGSTDGTVDVIKKYDDRITHWVSEPDKGIYNAMNKGIKVASGEYCNFMNAGDTFADNSVLERVTEVCNDSSVMTGDTQTCHLEHGQVTFDKIWHSPEEIIGGWKLINDALSHQSSFMKTKLLKNNPYNEDFKICSDWQFFVDEIVMKGESYQKIPFVVSCFDGNGISNPRNRDIIIEERKKFLSTVLPHRVCVDYEDFIHGRTPLERILRQKGENSFIYSFLTFIAVSYVFLVDGIKKYLKMGKK